MRLLLALALLLVVPQRADSRPCPRPCSCPQPVELHCTFRSLIAIPPGISPDVQRINLGFNSIHKMTESSLSGLRKLELLMLHGNDLHGLPDGALRDLTSLQMLKMSYNKLSQITRRSLQGLWSLARLHLDHNRLEFIHPDAFQGLTALRVLQLEGNRLRQLHPATFTTFSLFSHFHVSTLRHLYLADNNLTSLQPGLLQSAPLLENLQLHGNLWNCDCSMSWLQGWGKNSPGVLKCKKDKDYPGGELCATCAFPRRLQGKEVQALEDMVCSGPVITSPPRATKPEDPASEVLAKDAFAEPLGNITLGLSDEHGNKVDLECAVGKPRELGRVNWEQVSQHRLTANISWSVDLDCPIDRENYERLWRLIAYYSDVPAHLQREAMLSKDPQRSYRYRQDMERDAQYYTGVKVIVMAQPRWLMQASLGIRLNRPQSTGKRVKLVLSTQLSQSVEAELERRRSRTWVTIESNNTAQTVMAVVVGGTSRMVCSTRSSGEAVLSWMMPDGSQLTVPYSGPNGRVSASSDGQLVIKSVDHSDTGLYYCIAKVHGDVDVLPFRLAVEESSSPSPGDDRLQLSPIQGFVGQPIALPCEASGSPHAEIHWILPGSNIVSTRANSSRAFVYSNGSLQVPHAQVTDSGYYKCVAINPHGVDTLATMVNVTRPVTQTVMRTQRKFAKRPQSASGVRTKIKVRTEEPVGGSGDGQVTKDGNNRTTADVGKRRVPISGRRVGVPSRSPWRRPPMFRKPLQPHVDPRNTSTDARRRVNVASNKIDPRKWADILAKVRDKTVQNNVTPNTVRQTMERRRTVATTTATTTTTTMLLEGNMEGSGEAAPTAPMHVVKTTNNIPGTPGTAESKRVAHTTPPDPRANTINVTPHPSKTPSTQADRSTRLTQSTRVAPSTPTTTSAQGMRSAQTPPRDTEPFTPNAPIADSGPHAAWTHLPALQRPTSAPQSRLTRWQTHTNRASSRGSASADDSSQGNHDTEDAGAVTTQNTIPSTAPPEVPTTQTRLTAESPADGLRERGRERGRERQKRPHSKRKNGGRRQNKGNRRQHRLNAALHLMTTAALTPANALPARAGTTRAPLKIESAALTTTVSLPTAVPFTGGQVTSSARVSHKESTVSRLQEDEAGARRPSSSPPAPAGRPLSTVAPPARATRALRTAPLSTLPSTADHPSTEALAAADPTTSASPPLSAVTDSAETQRGSSVPGERRPASRSEESPRSDPTPQQWSPDVRRRQQSRGRPLTHSQAEEHELVGKVSGPAPLPPPVSSPAPTAQHASSTSSSGEHEASGAEGLPGDDLYEDVSGKRPTTAKETLAVGRAGPPSEPTETDVGDAHRKQTADPQGKLAGTPLSTVATRPTPSTSIPSTSTPSTSTLSKSTPSTTTPSMTTPSTSTPSTSTPSTSTPSTSTPSTSTPLTSTPSTSTPSTSTPSTSTPSTSAPSTSTPSTSTPSTSTPLTSTPSTSTPSTSTPSTSTPSTSTPSTSTPSTPTPSTSTSSTSTPSTSTPLTSTPSTSTPSKSTPSTSTPSTSTPSTSAPSTSAPSTSTPSTSTTSSKPTASSAVLASVTPVVAFSSSSSGAGRGINPPLTVPRPDGSGFNHIEDGHASRDEAQGQGGELPPLSPHGPSRNFSQTGANQAAAGSWRETLGGNAVDLKPGPIPTSPAPELLNAGPPTRPPPPPPPAEDLAGPGPRLPALVAPPRANPWIVRVFNSTVTVNAEADAQLPCEAVGQPYPFLSWTKVSTGSSIAQNTKVNRFEVHPNGTLVIRRAQPTDRGQYLCRVQSQQGQDQVTLNLVVLLQHPRVLQPRHRDVTAQQGTTVDLDCTVVGHPPPSVAWVLPDLVRVLTASQPAVASGGQRRLALLGNGTLRIARAGPADGGVYRCVGSSVAGNAAATVRLSVLPSPPPGERENAKARIMAAAPRSTEVAYGGSLRLDCLATGRPDPRIIWRTPANKLVDSQYSYDPRIKVFANGSLALRGATEADAGDFLCLARNRLGDDFAPLRVAVLTRPAKIERQRLRSSQEVAYGGRLRVDCVASGLPDPAITWALPDGTMVNAADKMRAGRTRRYVVFDNGSLLLNEVGAPQEGDYTCYAENQLGKDQMKVSVKVKGAALGPRTSGDEDRRVVSVPYGQTASLHCGAQRGSWPGSFISWVSPINRVVAPVPGKYQVLGDGTLVVHRVQRSDGGNYTCVARNGGTIAAAGQSRAVTALEVLLAPPTINGLPGIGAAVVAATAGRRTLVDCVAAGTPPPRTMWVLPGNVVLPVPYGGGARTTVHPNGTLELRAPRRAEAGRLACVARNEAGEARLEVDLSVREAPDPGARTPGGPGSQSVALTVGRTMVLNCSLQGVPASSLTWVLPGGLLLPSGARLPLISHRPDGALLLLSPTAADAGVYRCLARGHAGSAAVTVASPDAAPVVVLNGQSFWLHCGGSGTLRWTLPSGAILSRATQVGRYAVLPNGTLAVRQATAHDRGTYVCRVAGGVAATVEVVVVSHTPRITNGPPPTTHARRGVALQLNCGVAAAAEVAWETPDRARLPVGTRPRLYGNKYVHPQGALVIQNPTARDAGLYRCTARNAAGVDSRATYLSVF